MDIIRINGTALPEPDGELKIKAEKVKTETETEAGTTQIVVVRNRKLTVSAEFTLTGAWIERFRAFRDADYVTASLYYPDSDAMSDYTVQFEMDESLIKDTRKAAHTNGIYSASVTLTEL